MDPGAGRSPRAGRAPAYEMMPKAEKVLRPHWSHCLPFCAFFCPSSCLNICRPFIFCRKRTGCLLELSCLSMWLWRIPLHPRIPGSAPPPRSGVAGRVVRAAPPSSCLHRGPFDGARCTLGLIVFLRVGSSRWRVQSATGEQHSQQPQKE